MAKALQTVIVKKSKEVKSLIKAAAIARHHADRLYTHRETASSWRFRQRPPSLFRRGSFRTYRVNDMVSLVHGDLK
jgi:hypothetical protein